jgi:hypothetical protein
MSEYEARVLADLQVLKIQMEQILGNGQPGRLHGIETRMVTVECGMQRLRGATATFGVLLTLAQMAIGLFTHRV